MKTLRLKPTQATVVEFALMRSMHEHESHAATEFAGLWRCHSQKGRDDCRHYMSHALDSMRECHELRQRLMAPPRRRKLRRTH